VLLLTVIALATASASAARQEASFSDSVGDGNGAPDIVSVSVDNDARGNVTVLVFFLGAVAPPADVQVTLVLDTDQNTSTGSNGFDYAFQYDARDNTHAVGRWDGTRFAIVDAPTSTVQWTALTVAFAINQTDLGGTSGFDFWIRAQQEPPNSDKIDDAPNDGTWSYTFATVRPARVFFPATLAARAGKVFDARAVRLQMTDGTRVAAERLTCRLSAAGAPLKALAGGCRWRIPGRLRGKPVVLTVVAAYGDAELRATKRLVVRR
jgi:hypothetical protein